MEAGPWGIPPARRAALRPGEICRGQPRRQAPRPAAAQAAEFGGSDSQPSLTVASGAVLTTSPPRTFIRTGRARKLHATVNRSRSKASTPGGEGSHVIDGGSQGETRRLAASARL